MNNTIALPLVTQVAAQTIGMNLVSVQPMSEPEGVFNYIEPFNTADEEGDGILRWHIKANLGFFGICNTILYSHNEEHIAYAYNELFTTYRIYLKREIPEISKSCLEEVIYKILNDSINTEAFEMHGEKFAPFTKLIALVREPMFPGIYTPSFQTAGYMSNSKDKKYRYIDLRKMILYYVKEHEDEIKDEQLKFFLKKNLNNFKK